MIEFAMIPALRRSRVQPSARALITWCIRMQDRFDQTDYILYFACGKSMALFILLTSVQRRRMVFCFGKDKLVNWRALSSNYYPDRLGAAGWAGWPTLSHKHCLHEPASSTSLSYKRTNNDTNQPTKPANRSGLCTFISMRPR